jgi:4-hydroxybenzoate polyprenyltransferase
MTVSLVAKTWALVRLIRPKQWVKNVFVLAPLVFARQFADLGQVRESLLAFALFCVASSACYILNDLHDVARDRRHSFKRWSRPIAAGTVAPSEAYILLGTLLAIVAAALAVKLELALVVVAYVLLNAAYTFILKYQPVIDIFAIATGFVLRVLAGSVALDVPLSGWMMITTLCLALYLAAIKRRQELALSGSEGREVLVNYSVPLMDRYAEIAATGALVFYSLFVMSANHRLTMTIPLVIFGLFRYWYVVDRQEGGESPTDVLLYDWPMLAVVAAWVGICGWVLSTS